VILTGALAMADEPKKDPPKMRDESKLPLKPETGKDGEAVYTEKVSARYWAAGEDGGKGRFNNAVDGIDACLCKNKEGKMLLWMKRGATPNLKLPRGSEITDGYGVVWVVDETRGNSPMICEVAKKSAKKP
jgi:hypothetical protein